MDSVIDAAKSVNIYSVIQKYAPEFIRPKHTNSNAHCPFHKDSKPSFHVYDRTNSFHCFSCGASGTGIDFVMRATGLCDPLSAAEELCNAFGLAYNIEPIPPENKLYYDVYAYVESLFSLANNKYAFSDGSIPNDYWAKRGVDSVASQYGLGYCPPVWLDKDKRPIRFDRLIRKRFPNADLAKLGLAKANGDCVMSDRYTIPIRDAVGRTVAFSGRARDETNPAKYKNTPETMLFKKRELLWNWDKAKGYPKVFIVEGPLDALSLIVSGVKNVVSIMGSAITPVHLALLDGMETILALDNDHVGYAKTSKCINENNDRLFSSLKIGTLGAYKDFNDALMAGENLERFVRRSNIVYGAEYIMQHIASTFSLTHLPDREFLYDRVKELLSAGIYSEVAIDTFTAKVRRLLGIKDRRL